MYKKQIPKTNQLNTENKNDDMVGNVQHSIAATTTTAIAAAIEAVTKTTT